MSKTLNFSYKWDKELFLRASHEAYKYEMKHSPKRFLGWLFIAMTQFGVIAAFKGAPIGLLLVSTFLVVYWYFFRWGIRRYILAKSFDKEMRYHVSMDEKKIQINDNSIAWEHILEVISLEKGFLLLSTDAFFFFPKPAFKDMDERNLFTEIVKAHVKRYTKD